VPARLASPFDPGPPHPLARRAAEELQADLRHDAVAADFDPGVLDAPGGGKIFGVLAVAAKNGRIGYLRAFSGMLGGRWHVDGFAPPLFDPIARDTFWPGGQAELRTLELRHAELREAGARVNSINPGIIATPMAQQEMSSEGGPVYRAMIEKSATGRMGTPEDVASAAAFLLGPESSFMTGADLLIDGGVIAALRSGRLQLPGV
jgi:hypothetical protein